MAEQPIVQAIGLTKAYNPGTNKEVEVLHGVDMQAFAGEFVAIIGQSGSGKSTLLNILGALDTPTSGQVLIDGIDIATLSSDGLASLRGTKIGFVFQFHHLLDEFSCLENTLMPVLIQKGAPEKADIAYAKHLLQRVGLESQMHKRANQMSGGQQQRNAIVRALCNKPKLVLADEPTGNLDSHSGQEVFKLMREIARETGVAFLMVTHDDRLAAAADRILRIEDGLISEVSAGGSSFDRPQKRGRL
ncbi:ABC transporter ATP-binding protein [Armatimonas sp.]|uniref:ABC transporter ATP-binding protein n=1 Tax=Armatimonas sp. TaxID=1872638 RepID=UPI00286AE805|nr:ABC transporter ATP-binding protein [Armatimonas sp.]